MSVAGIDLPATDDMKVLGVVLVVVCHSTATRLRWQGPSADDGSGAHPGVQPHAVSAGLLQCCVALCPSQQHSEATAHLEHRGTNRSPGTATVAVSTTPRTVTLAASPPTH